MSSFVCEFCSNVYNTKYYLLRHQNSESCRKIQKIIIECNNKNEKKLKDDELKHNDKIKTLEFKISELIKENKILKNENETLKTENKSLEKSNESFRKIVEKAATKSTKTTVNNSTYNRNNYLNYVSSEPIKFGEIQQKINNLVNTKTIMFDNDNFNNYITKNILKDESGKDKVLCTDIPRKNFTYKDETSGQMISDPELEKLREKLKNTSHNTSVKKDLLEKLISKYEGTLTDPYVKFYECLQNIEYGQPFIEHVAKKTYVKNKPILDKEEQTLEIRQVDLIDKETAEIQVCQSKDETILENNVVSNIDDDDIDIDNVNINEIDDIEILDRIIMKYEKRMKEKQITL